MQHGERVRLVVIGRREAHRANGGDDRGLLAASAAGDRVFDGADGDAAVGDAVVLGPSGERGPHTAPAMRGIDLARPDEVDALVADEPELLASRLEPELGG